MDSENTVMQFRVGDKQFATHVLETSEVVPLTTVTSIPGTSDSVEGVMDLRGETVKLINPVGELGVEHPDGEKVLVFHDSVTEDTTGLIVNDPCTLEIYTEDELCIPEEEESGINPYVLESKVCADDCGPVYILEPRRLIEKVV